MIRKLQNTSNLVLAAALVGAVAALAPAAKAQDYLSPSMKQITLFDSTLSNETVTATSRAKIAVPGGTIPVLQLSQIAADAGTSNVVVSFVASLDGDNWTTTTPYTVTNALTGTNKVTAISIIGTNLPVRFLSLEKIATTQTNLVTLSNVRIAFLPIR